MKLAMNEPGRQYRAHKQALDAAVLRVLESGWWIGGEEVDTFTREFAAWCDLPGGVCVANGTDALELALRCLEDQPGTAASSSGAAAEVVTVANAGGYTTTACRLAGLTPVYVDVTPELVMHIPAALAAVTPRTRAVVATHLYGIPLDVPALRAGLDAMGRQDVAIVEDCAQAHGALHDGARCGSMGDLACFSFYPTKNLGAMGDGGFVGTRHEHLRLRLQRLAQYGWQTRYDSVTPMGRNSRLDAVQAAVLRVKLPYVDAWNAARRAIVQRYAAVSPALPFVGPATAGFVGHLAVCRHPRRDALQAFLAEAGVASAVMYPRLDPDQASQQGLPMVVHDLSESRRALAEILTLPCYAEMTAQEVDHVCDVLARFLRQ
ncbi:DegT/DnrJ/EryC1/StrS family aminotransferase [Megalodesulfovibrio paquesii]